MDTIGALFSSEFFYASIRMASPIILAAIGELMLERAGIINLGVEAFILFGAFFGVLGAHFFGGAWSGVLFAVLVGALISLVFSVAVITINAHQAVTGAAFNIFAVGLTSLMARVVWGVRATPIQVSSLSVYKIPILSDIPVVGRIFFEHTPLIYLSYLLVILVNFMLFYTTWGLKIRAIGEDPKAAETMGINVIRWKYIIATISCCFASVAGAILSISFTNMFADNMSAGRGYMAIATVILGQWNPWGCLAGGLIFGMGNAFQMRLQAFGVPFPKDLLLVFPMIIALLIIITFKGKSSAKPAALGQPYNKEV